MIFLKFDLVILMMKIKKDKQIFFKIWKLYLITRIILVVMMLICNKILPSSLGQYMNVMSLFDNEHYLNIAENGYLTDNLYAFFPLVPLLIRHLGRIGFLVINQLWVFLSGYLFYLLSKEYYNDKHPLFSSILWFLSPISIFTCMFYSEGLFVFLTLLAFYIYKKKKNYLFLGIVLGLAVLTRSLGSMLFFSIFIFMFIDFIKKREKFKNILITFIPASIISLLYPIFLYVKTGDFLYFSSVQFLHWNRVSTNIFMIVYDAIKALINDFRAFYLINTILTILLFGYVIYLVIENRKEKKYYDMFLYLIFSILIICSTIRANGDAMASFYRYLYGCFPIYFLLPKNEKIIVLNIFLTAFITSVFLMGYYFY